jgi:hypothetical protein
VKQAGKLIALCVALLMAHPIAPPAAHAASKSTASASRSKKISLHRFTGVVTALDKTSITVEKGGKKPKTMVFEKHAEMKSTGDLSKDARVTVFYREEDGKSVAHRVVVKT